MAQGPLGTAELAPGCPRGRGSRAHTARGAPAVQTAVRSVRRGAQGRHQDDQGVLPADAGREHHPRPHRGAAGHDPLRQAGGWGPRPGAEPRCLSFGPEHLASLPATAPHGALRPSRGDPRGLGSEKERLSLAEGQGQSGRAVGAPSVTGRDGGPVSTRPVLGGCRTLPAPSARGRAPGAFCQMETREHHLVVTVTPGRGPCWVGGLSLRRSPAAWWWVLVNCNAWRFIGV